MGPGISGEIPSRALGTQAELDPQEERLKERSFFRVGPWEAEGKEGATELGLAACIFTGLPRRQLMGWAVEASLGVTQPRPVLGFLQEAWWTEIRQVAANQPCLCSHST